MWQELRGQAEGTAQLPYSALSMFGALEHMLAEQPGFPDWAPSTLCQLAQGTHGHGGCGPAQGPATSKDFCMPQNTRRLPPKRVEKWLEARTGAEKPVE